MNFVSALQLPKATSERVFPTLSVTHRTSSRRDGARGRAEPGWGRAGREETARPGIALTFLPRNASGISKQVNRGAARRNYCSGFVKFANVFGGGVRGERNEQSTCC